MSRPGLKRKKILVLDIGTSYIKCGCIDSEYNIISQYQREFPMVRKELSYEIDFDLFFNTTSYLISECLADQKVKRSTVEALLITSQAQTFTAVNADFSPIHQGIVWLDERAEEQAAFLKKELHEFAKAAGFQEPFPSLYVSKLLWLKQHEPDIYKKATAFPLINEYVAYKFTGKFYSDVSSFGMSGLYDYSRNMMNPELLSILGLTEEFFPMIENAAEKGEIISQQMQLEWKLNYRFPIYFCGNDQGASACGAGLKKPGDLNINFGTAMVFYTITDSLVTELTDDQITGKHPVGNYYFLLNLESDFGMQIRKLKNKYFKNGTYDQLFETYINYPNVNAELPNSRNEDHVDSLSTENMQRYCAGIIKYYMLRLKVHFDQICQVVTLNEITISGGITKSRVWLKILEDVLKKPFIINNREDAGLLGAVEIYLNH